MMNRSLHVFLGFLIVFVLVRCTQTGNNRVWTDGKNTPSTQIDSSNSSTAMAALLTQLQYDLTENSSTNPHHFVITYSSECPISMANVSELQRIVHWLDSVKRIKKVHELPKFTVLVESPLSKPYNWLSSYCIVDSGFQVAKKLGFAVYPELRIFKHGVLRYAGKLNNRSLGIGRKSTAIKSSDSSFLWIQWLNCQSSKCTYLVSNEAVGCYIE